MLITETSEQGLRDIGANLKYTRFVRGEEQSGSLQQISTSVFDPLKDFSSVTLPAPDQALFNAGGTTPPLRPDEDTTLNNGIQTRNGFGFTASIINPGYGTVEGTFRTLETTDEVDLVSKPEVLVVDQGTATIKAGSQVPYQSVTTDTLNRQQLNIVFKDVGVNMVLVPRILTEKAIQLHLQTLNVSEVARIENLRGLDLPVFSQRSQTGLVMVPDGETLVIGGLTTRVIRKTDRQVPFVGSLPVVGTAFRSRESEANFTHLLIFITPTIVDLRTLADNADALSAVHFWRERGGEYRNSQAIENELAAMGKSK